MRMMRASAIALAVLALLGGQSLAQDGDAMSDDVYPGACRCCCAGYHYGKAGGSCESSEASSLATSACGPVEGEQEGWNDACQRASEENARQICSNITSQSGATCRC